MNPWFVLTVIALGACGPAANEGADHSPGGAPFGNRDNAPASNGAEAPPLPPPALPVKTLAGQWLVDAGPTSLQLDIGAERIEFDNCQQIAWRYALDDGDLTIARTPAITIDIAPKPLPCAARFPPPVETIVTVIDSATRADPAAAGGVTLSGTAGRIVLKPKS